MCSISLYFFALYLYLRLTSSQVTPFSASTIARNSMENIELNNLVMIASNRSVLNNRRKGLHSMIDDSNEKAVSANTGPGKGRLVRIAAEAVSLSGILNIPAQSHGMVILAHGIDAAVANPHQNLIALSEALNQLSLATLQVDLFSSDERAFDQRREYFRQNIDIMQQRIVGTAQWLTENPSTDNLSIGYFGIDEVGAAALIAAAQRPDIVAAVVAAGQHADIAQSYIQRVLAPTLLLAAEKESVTTAVNQQLFSSLQSEKQSESIHGVSALFESEQALNEVTRLVGEWFARWLVTIG